MNPAFTAVTRREYVRVGSAPASMLVTVTAVNAGFMSSEFVGQQWDRVIDACNILKLKINIRVLQQFFRMNKGLRSYNLRPRLTLICCKCLILGEKSLVSAEQ